MSGIAVVLDIGKTNVKLIAFDAADGAEIWKDTCPNLSRLDGPYPHADVESIETFLLDGLADVAKAVGGALEGITVTTHGASGALLASNRLALPVLDYEYEDLESTAEAYQALRPSFAETASPRLPAGLNLGAQLYWQQCRFSDRFAAATCFVTYPQYWAFRLCGVAATEVTSLGCHTDLWSPGRNAFSSLVARAGWARLMAPVRRAGDVLGTLDPAMCQRLGLRTSPPIYCGIQDSNASALPFLADGPPRSIVSSGTWAIHFALGVPLTRLDEARDTCANVDLHGRPVPTARFMGGREFDVLMGGMAAAPTLRELSHVLDSQAMVLPSFAPGSGPFPQGRGRWTIAPDALTPGERQATASLYLALMSNVCLNLVNASGETVILGPFADNSIYCDALATLTGRRVSAMQGLTATATGAARLMLPRLPPVSGTAALGVAVEWQAAFAAYAAEWTARSGAR